MITDPSAENPEPGNPPPVDQQLRSRALAKYQHSLDEFPEKYADLTLEDVRQTIHELHVHQIELQMQNDELRQAQCALEESRSRFKNLYDNAPVGYCHITADGLIGDANCTLGDMLGYTQAQLDGRKFTSLIDSDDQDVFYHLRRLIVASLSPQTCELRMHRSDASCTWIELSAAIASVDGDAVCLRVALMNIDARVRAEAAQALLENQLRESQKMEAVGTLAGGIAHDFNNILTVILVNAEMTDRLTKDASPTVTPFVNEIQKAAGRARELVNQILAFCRREPTDRQVVSLAEVIEESIGMLRATMPARFQLHFTCDNSVPEVLADRMQIEQVLVNLATNAMQAMEGRPGHLRVQLDAIDLPAETIAQLHLNSNLWAAGDRAVRIVCTDDGPGMEPAVVDRIFEPFFTTKPINQGTGLGLAVVHGIVHAHDGQISVQSKPGQGTAFTIYLPPVRSADMEIHGADARKPKGHRQESDRAQSYSAAHFNRNIIYVDDDSFVLNAIVRLLGEYGVFVRGYSAPTAALQFLQEASDHIDVLVTDYNMPGISGLEFAKQVHQIRPALPVVVTSGYIDHELQTHANDAGVLALLPKPFTAKGFLEILEQVDKSREN